ncbi:hypothetical protein C6P40_004252 [Pichia californica]|uniref:SGTA homodimerisation domain-containing protein n=1 Tax=Pichia californica TaxID=460514 RepID=A0A9P6WMK1_9ASCO|nr:hypothetical protein C6P40_004252 [[Candida] californica]
MSTSPTHINSSTEKSVEELRLLGNEKFRSLNYGAALMLYTQAIDKDPSSFAIYYNRAVALVKMDAMKEAKDDLLKSLEINPEYIPSLCQIGFLYLYEGNTPDSLESYVKVVKLNMNLPNQLNRFKAQLKEAIRLAESRCRQQEYPQEFIDSIITPEIRSTLESYPNLPTHMIESGIPPVAFGNVPISHQFENPSVIARASIPIAVNGIRASNPSNTNQNNSDTTNGNNGIASMINLPNILGALNGTPGVSASVTIGGPQSPEELMSALGNITNTEVNESNHSVPTYTPPTNTTATSTTSTGTQPSNQTSTIGTPTFTINGNPSSVTTHHPIIRHTTSTGLPVDILQSHREAHQQAINRANELRRQREQSTQTQTQAQTQTSQTTPTDTTATVETATATAESSSSSSSSNNNNTSDNTTTADSTAPTFARQFASTIATQLTNAALQNASQVSPNATPNNGAIQSLAQNLTSIASGVLGSLSGNNNNFVSMVSSNNNNSNTSASNNTPLDADLDMDLD